MVAESLQRIGYGELASSEILNNNFEYLKSFIEDVSARITANNDSIRSDISTVREYLLNQINQAVSDATLPVGTIFPWSTTTPPENYIAMVGQNISSYSTLVAKIGKSTLPNTVNRVPEGSTTPLNTINAGLPNITGFIDPWTAHSNASIGTRNGSGAMYSTGTGTIISRGETAGGCSLGLGFNASRCSNLYGASSTVQMAAFTVVWIIKYQ